MPLVGLEAHERAGAGVDRLAAGLDLDRAVDDDQDHACSLTSWSPSSWPGLEPDQHRPGPRCPSAARPGSGSRPESSIAVRSQLCTTGTVPCLTGSEPGKARLAQDGAIRLNRRMALAVDRYELGPIGTNCYVVRTRARRPEAVVVDPGDDAATLRLELARTGARGRRDPRHAHALRPHRRRSPTSPRRTGAPVYVSETEAPVLASPDDFYPGMRIRPWQAEHDARRRRDARARRDRASRRSTCPATRPATSRSTRTARSSPATSSSRARSAAPTCRTATGTRWSSRSARSSTASRPRRSSTPGHGPPTTLGAELARNPFLAELRAVKFEAPRGTHDILPSEQPRWRQVITRVRAPVRALRLPPDRHAGVRGHGALRAHLGRGVGHRLEGDVHVRRTAATAR